jgi:nucleotidyltransferase substrate binding protein (TIGR01987 family)
MKNENDIRWEQRFSNYRKALSQLSEFFDGSTLNRREEQGLVKSFEYTYELAWHTLKDFLEYQGVSGLIGSRDAFRRAFEDDLLADGHLWMEMIKSRNKTSHTYNEETAREIIEDIKESYYPAFLELENTLLDRVNAG